MILVKLNTHSKHTPICFLMSITSSPNVPFDLSAFSLFRVDVFSGSEALEIVVCIWIP